MVVSSGTLSGTLKEHKGKYYLTSGIGGGTIQQVEVSHVRTHHRTMSSGWNVQGVNSFSKTVHVHDLGENLTFLISIFILFV